MVYDNLDTVLIDFSDRNISTAEWTIRHAVEGVQIFGGIGSGKTSGSGRLIALKYLLNNLGGLVLTAKEDEKAMWVDFCRQTGRLNDLIIVEPGGQHAFNFLQYESKTGVRGNAITENVVQVLKTVIRAGQEKQGKGSNDEFWEDALNMLLTNTIDLCILAYGHVDVQKLYDIIISAPKKTNEPETKDFRGTEFFKTFERANSKILVKVASWEQQTGEVELNDLYRRGIYEQKLFDAIPDAKILKIVDDFFSETFKNLNEKTRSIVEFSFSGFLFRLLREPIFSLFCRNASTFVPEDCLDGKIILLNLPVKIYNKAGRDSQILFKYIWQRAMEKRTNNNLRPVFLWADEAQNFIHEYDAEYQATARSSRIATVYISQNLPNYFASMTGSSSENRVKSFLGTLGTKIFHNNTDLDTNKFASDLIGQAWVEQLSSGVSGGGGFGWSETKTDKLESLVRPEEFVRLRSGGPANNYCVAAYMHSQGATFRNHFNFGKVAFNQNYVTNKNNI